MALVAKASNTVRNKNLLMLLMCVGFFVWFTYDGFVRYPGINDQAVRTLNKHFHEMPGPAELQSDVLDRLAGDPATMSVWRSAIEQWPGWNKATGEQREQMDRIVGRALMAKELGIAGWKKPFADIEVQRDIVYGLAVAVIGAIWWLIHCQKRRAIAEEGSVSPAPGIVIPWDKITVVDNTRWKKSGIVDITYVDEAGTAKKAKFDDYELDREPLLSILDMLSDKATHAEFIPKEEPAAE